MRVIFMGTPDFSVGTLNALVEAGKAQVRVLETGCKWYGVTYRVDREPVAQALRELTQAGEYPSPVWGG